MEDDMVHSVFAIVGPYAREEREVGGGARDSENAQQIRMNAPIT